MVCALTIAEKERQLTAELSVLRNSQDRLAYLVQRGRRHPPLDESFKTDVFRIEGCLAKLWWVCESRAKRCYFRTDSDSAIVKGIAAILCDLYSDQTPAEILSLSPAFLERLGINQHLTQNRRNSLGRVWEKICRFAEAVEE